MTPDPSDSERSPTADAVRISRRGSAARGRFLARPGRVAVSVLVAGLAVTAAATLTASALDHDNEHRLLEVQTRQAGAVLASTILSIESPLETALRIESATGGDTQEFQRYMASVVGPGRLFVSASLWTTDGSTVQPLTTVGRTPPAASATATRAFVLRAFHRAGFAVTGVPKGRPQDVDYAIADARTTHFVVSAVRAIPADRRVPVESNLAFADLSYATYLGPTAQPSELSTTNLPPSQTAVTGDTARVSVPFGDTTLTLVAAPAGQLGGQLGADLPWIFLVGGVLLAIAAAVVADRLARRRKEAEDAAGTIGELYERLDHLYGEQRSIAETLQRALLPQGNPSIAGLDMATRFVAGAKGVDVGGDWYSLFPLDDHRFAFVVGDVSGRGVSAAAVMARLRFTMRAYLVEGHPPDAVLTMCSGQIDLSTDGHFSTALVGTGDLGTGELTLANAGHLPPLVVSPDGAHFVETDVGPPLGVAATTSYSSRTLHVAPGVTMVVFTDGLVERRGEDLDVSLQRLADRAGRPDADPDELLHRLVGDVARHEYEDDLAVLAFRLVEPGRAPSGGPAPTGSAGQGSGLALS